MQRLSMLVMLVTLGVASVAHADPPPPVDVAIHDAPPPRRLLSVEWNPVSAVVYGKWGANAALVPVDHHALVVSPFYASNTTKPIYVPDNQGNLSIQLPVQTFSGFGGEIGYRYYMGHGGPRGFFAGPSLVIAAMTATAQNGDKTSYFDYGLAVDAGYEVLVADDVALSFGAGAQYTTPSKSIPNQQFPALVYANSKFVPRALLSIGWAF